MKAIISSTYDDNYFFFLPIATWAWNKLGVDVICFMPEPNDYDRMIKLNLVNNTMIQKGIFPKYGIFHFKSSKEKEASFHHSGRYQKIFQETR